MYLLLKGKLENFRHSLTDYVERKSELIKRYPKDVFLWGAGRRYSYFSKGVKAFLYVSREEDFPGGIVLYGELEEPTEMSVKYWPEGEWRILLPIRVIKFAKNVLSNPNDPSKWGVVTYDALKGMGIRIMPSSGQRIDDEKGEKIASML